jgi:hypothetical protein
MPAPPIVHALAGGMRFSTILTASRDNSLAVVDGNSLVPDTPPKVFR